MTLALAAVVAAAVPLVPGLPDLNPEQGSSPPGSPPPAEERKTPPAPPSEEAKRICDRMAAPTGDDRASGKPSAPFRTPKRLARALRPGWTACLRAGTYTQTEVFVRQRKVTLRSAPGERAVWRGRVVLAERRQRLVDLTLDGTYGPTGLPSPTVNSPEAVISDSDITNRKGICIAVDALNGRASDGFVIQRNRIHDCGRRPETNNDHGIYVVDAVGGLIRDNVIFHNADRGVQLYPEAQRIRVVRNTIDGNGSGIIISNDSSQNVIRENLISNSVVRWNAETNQLVGRGNRFESNCVRPGHPDPAYHENGGVILPSIVIQRDNVLAKNEMYKARADGDYTPVESGCGKRGAAGPAQKPRP